MKQITPVKNDWNERYSISEFYYGKEPNDFLKENAWRIPANGKVLCLAEGEGRNAVFLAGLGYAVTAIDGSSVALDKLKMLESERGLQAGAVHTQVVDLNDYTISPDSWDAVVSIWCHVPRLIRVRLHQEAVVGLKAGGVFIFEAYHPRQISYGTGGPKDPDLLSTDESIKRELSGLRIEILRDFDRDIHEGIGHRGSSAVVQALGIKN